MSELFEHIDKLKEQEAKVAVATLVNTRGTTPRKEGAKMVVRIPAIVITQSARS
jgi:xanthine/CO dehydrogenase XdhC/CoxF family maturation factor